jgi:orotidine-5'-phosphate decarboxylase
MPKKNPLICAIDTPDVKQAASLASTLHGAIGHAKLGLEFFSAQGPQGIKKVAASGLPIFLDLKFHDIPNTVAGAVRSAASLGVSMLTIHTSGGSRMMKAAAEAASGAKKKPIVLGVTVLTSMDEADLKECGVSRKVKAQVLALAELALKSGIDGLVCSAHEVAALKKEFGKELKLVVPGIRPAGSSKGDQRRVMTPAEAIEAGADYLVIGRPITEQASPKKAAQAILKEINA